MYNSQNLVLPLYVFKVPVQVDSSLNLNIPVYEAFTKYNPLQGTGSLITSKSFPQKVLSNMDISCHSSHGGWKVHHNSYRSSHRETIIDQKYRDSMLFTNWIRRGKILKNHYILVIWDIENNMETARFLEYLCFMRTVLIINQITNRRWVFQQPFFFFTN